MIIEASFDPFVGHRRPVSSLPEPLLLCAPTELASTLRTLIWRFFKAGETYQIRGIAALAMAGRAAGCRVDLSGTNHPAL
jgi:hypothetical protein